MTTAGLLCRRTGGDELAERDAGSPRIWPTVPRAKSVDRLRPVSGRAGTLPDRRAAPFRGGRRRDNRTRDSVRSDAQSILEGSRAKVRLGPSGPTAEAW